VNGKEKIPVDKKGIFSFLCIKFANSFKSMLGLGIVLRFLNSYLD
jgi:hypothetical protein